MKTKIIFKCKLTEIEVLRMNKSSILVSIEGEEVFIHRNVFNLILSQSYTDSLIEQRRASTGKKLNWLTILTWKVF